MEENKKASGTLGVLRKRLFIAAAYLLVVAGLLAYVSYGQYRINIEVKVNMPTAATFEASLVLSPNETDARGWENDFRQLWLAGLAPGDDALEFAKEENPWGDAAETDTADTEDETEGNDHRIALTVRNWYEAESEGETSETGTGDNGTASDNNKVIAELPLKYNVRINGTGCLPLEFVLVEKAEDGTKRYYQSKVTVDNDSKERSYKFYEITEENETSTEEAELELGGGPEEVNGEIELPEVEKTVYLYVGWQKTDDSQDNNMAIKDYDSGAYRKEVERLEIRTVLTGKDVGPEILEEDELIKTIEGEGSKYGIYYKPSQSTPSPDPDTTPEP